MIPHSRIVPFVLMAGVLATGACAFQTGPARPRAEVAAVSACRVRADEVFERQNCDHVYRSDAYQTDTRDAPFATSGMRGVTTAGLSQQFGRDNTLDECSALQRLRRGAAEEPQHSRQPARRDAAVTAGPACRASLPPPRTEAWQEGAT